MRPLRALVCLAVLILPVVLSSAAEHATDLPQEHPIRAEERDHWAYQPIAAAIPPRVEDPRFAIHPVDAFLRSAMHRQQIEPMPRAGKATLLRRVTFDLTGLPPSPRELNDFLADETADAHERLVDRLLASPAYGERWAGHWLDLARFAESDGFEHDLVRPNAWRYRDWVVDALNRDLPYDEFLSLQIAGDLLRPGDSDAAVATGFLLCGPDMPDLNLQDERRHLVLNEMTSTVGAVFLGLQVGCAQCHDHKYDPIRQHDFYRLRAFFEPAEIFRDHPVPTATELAARAAAEATWSSEDRQRDVRRKELEESARRRLAEKNPDVLPSLKQALAELSAEEQKEHATLLKELRAAPRLPEVSMGRVLREGPKRDGHFYLRGDFRQKGAAIDCGFPRVLLREDNKQPSEDLPPRVQLAKWLTSREQPLAARVFVNRLWQWHFGIGLAAATSDFGVMGSEPTSPLLLDWLAQRFVDDGWSMKKLHRLLVTSEAYRMASVPFDHRRTAEQLRAAVEIYQVASARDPDNVSAWRRRRTRLSGEAIRDAMLWASGRLSTRRGGPGVRAPLPDEVTDTLLKDQWKVSGDDEDHRKRSIYFFVRRNLRYPMFDVFDAPDTNGSCALRHESTTSTQSLVLLNSEFSLDCARQLAGNILSSRPARAEDWIDVAYLRVLSRPATKLEIQQGQGFLERQQREMRTEGRSVDSLPQVPGPADAADPYVSAALVDFCLALFNANEFVYVD